MAAKSEPRKLTKADLPDVGDRRFWVIEHNPKSNTRPVKVTLMEDHAATARTGRNGRAQWARAVGFEFAKTAEIADVVATAGVVVLRVGNVDNVVGEF
jgi:hypothetical protein